MFSKKIVAAAALLALAAGAQAQVKLYGQVDMSVGSFKSLDNFRGNSIKSVTKVESGVMSTGSYIGFAGTEDLGGGLKAQFVLESYLGADTGWAGGQPDNSCEGTCPAAPFWSRSSHVALTGNFGKLALGQYDSPLYTLLTSYSPFGDSQVFAPSQVLHYGSPLLQTNLFASGIGQGTSWVNSITYETPNMAGFSATAQYAPKENSVPNTPDNKNNFGLGVSYNAGPLSASFVHSSTGDNDVTSAVPFYTAHATTNAIGASYNLGVATLMGEYTRTTFKQNSSPDTKTKFYQVGATVPVSAAGKFMVVYGQRKWDSSTAKVKQFSLGYEHSLSKRTSLYAAAGDLKLSSGNSSIKSSNYVVGIKHNF